MAPEFVAPSRTRRLVWLAFLASGAVPLVGLCGSPPDPMLLVYSLFVAACGLRSRLGFVSRGPGATWLRYLLLTVLVGFLTETLAWAGNYLARAEQPALLHPQLLFDLLLSPGIYGAWAIGWIVLTRRWRFSLAEVFVLQGVYGVVLEQQGAVLMAGLEAMPLGILLWLYVFLVYGSASGLAYLPFEAMLPHPSATRSRWKIPAALAVQFLATGAVAIAWTVTLDALGVTVPEPKPIWLAPLW